MTDAESPTKKLNERQVAFIAAYLGDARFNATKAALAAGYSQKTAGAIGFALLKNIEIRAAIDEWRNEASTEAITSIRYRVNRLAELESGYFEVIEARREAYRNTNVIGGATGLVVLQKKLAANGDTVDEYVADVALTKEIRATYEDVAKELGQRVERSETKIDATESFMAALRAYGGHDRHA